MSDDRITLEFESFQAFLEECSSRISEEGIFLATEEPRAVGSTVEFHLGLDSDFPLLRGTGEVVWVVEPDGGGEAPGMAVRYQTTDPATATLSRKIAERQRQRTGSAFELSRAGADGEIAAELPPPAERAPSPATQAVDALIGNAIDSEAETIIDSEAETVLDSDAETILDSEAETFVDAPAETAAEPLATAPERLPEPGEETVAAPTDAYEEPTVEMEPSPKRGRRGLWAILALLAALAGAAYWQRDLLLGKRDDPARAAREPAVEAPIEPETRAPAEPAIQTPAEPVTQTPAEPRPLEADVEAPDPAQSAPPPAPSGPLTRIEEIRWRARAGVTLLELVADGAFAADAYTMERLEDPPRLLLKISGVTAPLGSPTVAVGSEEVVGVRTGLHGSPPASALHVVVDLADPTAQVTEARAAGTVLQLRVASAAISP